CQCLIHTYKFENRMMNFKIFQLYIANNQIVGRSDIISGLAALKGAQVKATELRAVDSLIISGLCAEGITEVTELHHLDRGYVDFTEKLKDLGANIKRINHTEKTVSSR